MSWWQDALGVAGAFGVGTFAPDALRRAGTRRDEYRSERRPIYDKILTAANASIRSAESVSLSLEHRAGDLADMVLAAGATYKPAVAALDASALVAGVRVEGALTSLRGRLLAMATLVFVADVGDARPPKEQVAALDAAIKEARHAVREATFEIREELRLPDRRKWSRLPRWRDSKNALLRRGRR